MFFHFVWWEAVNLPRGTLDYVLGEGVRELHLVHVAHLLGLQIYAGSFETSQWGEMECCFSQGRYCNWVHHDGV
jgi:hypothetical protein